MTFMQYRSRESADLNVYNIKSTEHTAALGRISRIVRDRCFVQRRTKRRCCIVHSASILIEVANNGSIAETRSLPARSSSFPPVWGGKLEALCMCVRSSAGGGTGLEHPKPFPIIIVPDAVVRVSIFSTT